MRQGVVIKSAIAAGGVLALGFYIWGVYGYVVSTRSSAVNTAADKHGPDQEASRPDPNVHGNWRTDSSTDELTGEVTRFAIVRSGSNELIVRRTGKKLEVFLTVRLELLEDGYSNTVSFKFDDGKIKTRYWSVSSDNYALFSGNPREMVRGMRSAETVTVKYKPYDTIAETIVFVLTGANDALKDM